MSCVYSTLFKHGDRAVAKKASSSECVKTLLSGFVTMYRRMQARTSMC